MRNGLARTGDILDEQPQILKTQCPSAFTMK